MKKILLAAAFLGLGMFSLNASAIEQGDPDRGAQVADACAACHSADGNSKNPQFPKIAGQYADYMVQTLRAYKSGQRKNAIMAGIASQMSEQDMHDVAAYFSRQRGDLHHKDL